MFVADIANAVLNGRRTNYLNTVSDMKSFQKIYTYSGLLFCKEHPDVAFRRLTSSAKTITWMCGNYQRHGIKGCVSPRLKENELDKIMKKLLEEVEKDKDQIIDHLTSIYEKTIKVRNFDLEISKENEKIIDYKNKKEKLLDLVMKNLITDIEFTERNNSCNEEILNSEKKIRDIEADKYKSENTITQLKRIKKIIANNFDSEESFTERVQLLVDKIIVSKIDNDRKNIRLEVHLNLMDRVINITNGVIETPMPYLSCSHKTLH